jgi:hypothetical protein
MRAIILILLAVFTMTAYAQKSSVEKFIKKEAKTEGISIKEIEPGSEEFSSQFNVDEGDLKEAFDQIDIIKIISADSASTTESIRQGFFTNAQAALKSEDYISLMQVSADDGDDVSIYANQTDNGMIREFVLLVNQPYDVLMVYVKAEIDMTGFLSGELLTAIMKDKKGKDCD